MIATNQYSVEQVAENLNEQIHAATAMQSCGFEKLELHPGNIGYVKMNSFADPARCREIAEAVMEKLNTTDAVIFDLRDDRGGYPEMVRLIAGWLFAQRTPWYNQTDFNLTQNYKITETKALGFSATIGNLFNRRSVTQLNGNITSGFNSNFIAAPGGLSLFDGVPFYAAIMNPYNFAALLNSSPAPSAGKGPGPVTVNSGYGLPNRYQIGRTIRLGVHFTF